MKRLRTFNEFLVDGTVRARSPDPNRAKSLRLESERKQVSIREQVELIGVKDENANDYVEGCYDVMLYLIRACLYEDGYDASGRGAHEAEVAYARLLETAESDVRFLDDLRYFRNGILYYGRRLDRSYACSVLALMDRLVPALRR